MALCCASGPWALEEELELEQMRYDEAEKSRWSRVSLMSLICISQSFCRKKVMYVRVLVSTTIVCTRAALRCVLPVIMAGERKVASCIMLMIGPCCTYHVEAGGDKVELQNAVQAR